MLANCWCSVLPAPSITRFIQFIPFPAVFLVHSHLILGTPGHSSSLPTPLQCSLRWCGFPSGFGDPRDLSSPAPGLCSSLIWCSHNRAAALSGPALSVQRTVPRGQEPLPQLRSLALLPSWSLAQSKPRAGCACSGRRASHREHPMGASPAGEPEPGENFLGFFPPHSNAQDGRITTVR